jgi:glyoxylase-like metal-dependent hydrolase (beta-lactamase superfamily II)
VRAGGTWRVGGVRVTAVVEAEFWMPADVLLATHSADRLADLAGWLRPDHLRGADELGMTYQSLLVESRGARIVVDTCRGNDRQLPNGRGVLDTDFLARLDRLVDRATVDHVVCTHLHYDHVGWNTMLVDGRWEPTFPRARYLFSRKDFEHWSGHDADPNVDLLLAVEPIVEAGRHEFVGHGHRINDEVSLIGTPGHSPGHLSVWIESEGERGWITGDVVHHPVQLVEPEWHSRADVSPADAVATRRAMIDRVLDEGVAVIGTHFAAPAVGFLVSDDRWGSRLLAGTSEKKSDSIRIP